LLSAPELQVASMAAADAQVQKDTLRLKDGTSMEITRLPQVDDATWAEVKKYLEGNPEIAKHLQKFAGNPDALRGWLQTQVIHAHFTKQCKDDPATEEKLKALAKDPEMAPIVEAIKKDGLQGILQSCNDEQMMLKISAKMGGLSDQVKGALQALHDKPLTLHEACRNGNMDIVKEYITKNNQNGVSIDAECPNGITPLGYAVGANQAEIVKLLIGLKANPHAVDKVGNSGVHYAAGYGRTELLTFLLEAKADPKKANIQGKTPLELATINKQDASVEILKKRGA
jgi:hypothetical protein